MKQVSKVLLLLGFGFDSWLNDVQIQTLIILTIICGCAALFCFVVGAGVSANKYPEYPLYRKEVSKSI